MLILLAGCRCTTPTMGEPDAGLEAFPEELAFAATYLGASRTSVIELTNPTRFSRVIELSFSSPFEGPSRLEVPGGVSVRLPVTFRPVLPGEVSASLLADRTLIRLTGAGLAPLACGAAPACHAITFDADAGLCQLASVDDGTSCVSSHACFSQAECRAGECVGTLTDCDDGDRCTVDGCGPLGCVHSEAISQCPLPTNPCQVPTCNPTTGCGQADAVDGTECGPRDCDFAHVCLSGACLVRAAPKTPACVELVAGSPASEGSVDGTGLAARLNVSSARIAADPLGNVWLIDLMETVVRKIDPAGRVITVAGKNRVPGTADGFGLGARFKELRDIAVDGAGTIYVAEETRLRRMTSRGLVTTLAGGTTPGNLDGVGQAARFDRIRHLTVADDGSLYVVDGEVSQGALRIVHVSSRGEATTIHKSTVYEYISDIAGADGGAVIQLSAGSPRVEGLRFITADGGLTPLGPERDARLSTWGGRLVGSSGVVRELAPGTVDLWSVDAGSSIEDIAAGPMSTVFALVRSTTPTAGHLFRISPAGVALLAGPRPGDPRRDGPAADARFSGSFAGLCIGADGIQVAEMTITTVVMRAISAGQVSSQPISGTFPYFSGLACVSDGTAWTATSQGVQLLSRFDGGWAPTRDAGYRRHSPGSEVALHGDELIYGDRFTVNAISSDGGVRVAAGSYNPPFGSIDGPADAGRFSQVQSAVPSGDGGLWVSESFTIRFVDHLGSVSTVAGLDTGTGFGGDLDGQGSAARFSQYLRLAPEPSGSVLVSDYFNASVRRVTRAGDVTTLARLADRPSWIAVEDGGSVLVTVPGAVVRIRL